MTFRMAAPEGAVLAEPVAPSALAVDLNHLHRQTMGDRHLQRQVLRMFLRHAQELIERLKAAQSIEARREAAHSLVGSSKGIGAFALATIAAEIEAARGPVDGRLQALMSAAAAARAFIEAFLAT